MSGLGDAAGVTTRSDDTNAQFPCRSHQRVFSGNSCPPQPCTSLTAACNVLLLLESCTRGALDAGDGNALARETHRDQDATLGLALLHGKVLWDDIRVRCHRCQNARLPNHRWCAVWVSDLDRDDGFGGVERAAQVHGTLATCPERVPRAVPHGPIWCLDTTRHCLPDETNSVWIGMV